MSQHLYSDYHRAKTCLKSMHDSGFDTSSTPYGVDAACYVGNRVVAESKSLPIVKVIMRGGSTLQDSKWYNNEDHVVSEVLAGEYDNYTKNVQAASLAAWSELYHLINIRGCAESAKMAYDSRLRKHASCEQKWKSTTLNIGRWLSGRALDLVNIIIDSSDSQVIQELKERIIYLYKGSLRSNEGMQSEMRLESLQCFVDFCEVNDELASPDIVVTPEGNIRGMWKEHRSSYVRLEFLPTREISFVIRAPSKSRILPNKIVLSAGVCPLDQLMGSGVEDHRISEWLLDHNRATV